MYTTLLLTFLYVSTGVSLEKLSLFNNFSAEFNTNDTSGTVVEMGANATVVEDMSLIDTIALRGRVDPIGLVKSDFNEFVNHPVKIYHLDWTNASVYSLFSSDLIATWRAAFTSQMVAKTQNFLYFKGKIKIKVVVQGSPVAAGQLVVAFTPYVKSPMLGTPYAAVALGNTVNAKVVPHVIVDPSKSATYDLELPVCTPNGWYSFDSTYTHGSYAMEVIPYNTLISGTGVAPTVSVCVYMSLEEPVFEGMTILLSGNFVEEKKEGGTLSTFAKALAKGAMNFAGWTPVLGDEVTLFSKIAGTAGDVLAWFGFSKPPGTENNIFITNRTCDNYSQKDGKSTAIVLGASQSQSLALSPAYGLGTLDEMAFSTLCKIKGPIVIGAPITTALTKGTRFFSIGVRPTYCYSTSGPPVTYFPTPLAGVALVHSYWTGDMLVDFEVVASVFHRATLLVAWDPASNASPPTLDVALNTLQNVTVNVSGNTRVSLRVPWKQPMPWIPVIDVAASPTVMTTNGNLHFYVINPIQSNGSTDAIQYNVYFSSDNIKFAGPSCSKLQNKSVVTTLLSEDFVEETLIEFGPKTELSRAHLRCFGDESSTVKGVASRLSAYYTQQVSLWVASTDTITFALANQITPKTTTATTGSIAPNINYLSWFGSSYLAYRGSFRWTVGFDAQITSAASSENIKSITWHNVRGATRFPGEMIRSLGLSQSAKGAMESYAWTQPNLDVSSRIDIVAPLMIPTDFVTGRTFHDFYTDSVYAAAAAATATQTTNATCETICNGAGDDGVFSWFLGFPAFQ